MAETAAGDGHEGERVRVPGPPSTPDPPADPPARRPRPGRLPSHGPGHGPSRGYRWEPFTEGNEVRLTHGAHAPRHVEPLAAELVEAALAVSPYLADAAFAGELAAWSRAEARVLLLTRWLAEHGLIDPETGEPRPAAAFLVKCERVAAERRHALGLTPMARARLGRDVTAARVDLAREWADLDRDDRDRDDAELEVGADDRDRDDLDDDAPGEDGVHGWSEGAA